MATNTTIQTIRVPMQEYTALQQKAALFERIIAFVQKEHTVFDLPPSRNRKQILHAFRKTGKYNESFLKSFERGLRRSSFFSV